MSFLTGTNCELIYQSVKPATAKNTFTAEALINDVAGMGPQPILPPFFFLPSGSLSKGIRIMARGIISTTVTPTFQLVARLGGAAAITGPIIGQSPALTTGSGIANLLFELELDAFMETLGGAGANSTMRGLGLLAGAPFTIQGSVFGGGATPGTIATVDISITNYVNISAVCGTSSVSNAIQLLSLSVYGLN